MLVFTHLYLTSWRSGCSSLKDRFRSVFAARSNKKLLLQQKPHDDDRNLHFPGQVEEIGLALPPRRQHRLTSEMVMLACGGGGTSAAM